MARKAKSLAQLEKQVNAKWPNRSKENDGWIGDAAHASRKSDHNPNSAGVVCAMDFTHDPAHGLDARKLAEALVASKDRRIQYVISNRQIANADVQNWKWRSYDGSNPHTAHVHISVRQQANLYDDPKEWNLGPPPKSLPNSWRKFSVVATTFATPDEPQPSAYGLPKGWEQKRGVALPYRFPGKRPQVVVYYKGRSVTCDVVDVGPWNTNDPYWNKDDGLPQAASGTDTRGRKTNLAGIDLTPAAAKALGFPGKDAVTWEFVEYTSPEDLQRGAGQPSTKSLTPTGSASESEMPQGPSNPPTAQEGVKRKGILLALLQRLLRGR